MSDTYDIYKAYGKNKSMVGLIKKSEETYTSLSVYNKQDEAWMLINKDDSNTKVDIVNNLTDGGVDKVLSAEQGKVLFQYANDGKEKIANAIVGKGTKADKGESFDSLAGKISSIKTGYGSGDIIPKDKIQIVLGLSYYQKSKYTVGEKVIHSLFHNGSMYILTDKSIGRLSYAKKSLWRDPKNISENSECKGFFRTNRDSLYVVTSNGDVYLIKDKTLTKINQTDSGVSVGEFDNYISVDTYCALFTDGDYAFLFNGENIVKMKGLMGTPVTFLPMAETSNRVYYISTTSMYLANPNVRGNTILINNKLELGVSNVKGGIYRYKYNDYIIYTDDQLIRVKNQQIVEKVKIDGKPLTTQVDDSGDLLVLVSGRMLRYGESLSDKKEAVSMHATVSNMSLGESNNLYIIQEETSVCQIYWTEGANSGDIKVL